MRFIRAFVFYICILCLVDCLSWPNPQVSTEQSKWLCACVDLWSEIMWKIASNRNDHVKYSINKKTKQKKLQRIWYFCQACSFLFHWLSAAVVFYTNFFFSLKSEQNAKIIKEEYRKKTNTREKKITHSPKAKDRWTQLLSFSALGSLSLYGLHIKTNETHISTTNLFLHNQDSEMWFFFCFNGKFK